MTSERRERVARAATAALAALALSMAAGCARPSVLHIESFKDPYFPERFELRLDSCAYRTAAGQMWVVGQAASGPAVEDDPDSATTQLLEARLFWRPNPGKTPADASTITANVRYLAKTADGAVLYEGTAFVFPHDGKPGEKLRIDFESCKLKPTRTIGSARDWLGELKITGRVYAADDAAQAVDLSRNLDLEVGAAAP